MRRPTQFGRLSLWTIGAKGASRPSVAHGLLLTPRSVDFDFFVSLPPSPSQPMRSSCLSDWISLGFAASYRNLPAERSILLLPRGLFHRRRGPPARRRMVAGGPARAAHWATAHQPPTTPPPYTVLTPLVPGRQPANGPHGCRACLFRLAPKQGQTQTGPAAAWSVPDLDAPSHLHATPPHCPELRLHIPKVYHTPTPNAPSTQCHDPLVVCPAPSPRLRVCISLQGPIWRRPACVLRPVGKVALARSRYSAWEVVIAASACLAPGCKVLLRLHLSPSRYLVSRYISIGSMTSVVPNYSYSTFR